MYIATIPNRNSPPAILLRESYREGNKIKNRTLANLSSLTPERIKALKLAFRGEFDNIGPGTPEIGKTFGTLFALNYLAKETGVSRALGKSEQGKQCLFLTLARIAHQGSRLSAVRWSEGQAVRDILGLEDFNEDTLYKALDWLSERQDEIEKSLYKTYVKQHGKPPVLVLYDVTSSYFEGRGNELAHYGYNRDRKRGKKQIVIGLLTAADGEPLSVRVFEGNTGDPVTVYEQINTLKEKWGLSEVVFVGDKGMIKCPGKEALTEAGWHYITGLNKPEIRRLMTRKAIQLGLFDEQVQEVEIEGKRYVLHLNPVIKRHLRYERKQREERLSQAVEKRNDYVSTHARARPEIGLANLQKLAKNYRLDRYVSLCLAGKEVKMEAEDKRMEEVFVLDGCYVLETRIPKELMDKETINARYHSLTEVEQNFRLIKTECLEVRPIYLRRANRTRAHVLIAMMALKIVRRLRQQLKEAFGTTQENKYTVTIEEALEALNKFSFLHYKVGDERIVRLSAPNQQVIDIFNVLGLKLPAPKTKNVDSKSKRKKR